MNGSRFTFPVFRLLLLAALLSLPVLVLAQSGGGYDLTWNTVDGGGYTLAGGFWGGAAPPPPPGYKIYLPIVVKNHPRADVIFHNGTILTMEADQPQTQAIAIQGEKILAVGSNEEILALQGPTTQVVDLQGRTLMPGFVDAHTHIFNDAEVHLGMSLEQAQQLALENGITTLGDMFVPPDFLEQMQTFAREGRLRVRTSLYLIYNTNCGDIQGDWWKQHPPTREPGEMLRIGGVKIFADGGTCGRPALSFELPGIEGLGDLWLTQEQLNTAVAEAQAAGYQVVIHAIGDRAIEQAQNAIAFALGGQPNTLRHRIDHNSVIRPDLMSRYSEIGIVTVIFAAYPVCNPYSPPLPPAYRDWEWPWRALIDANPGLHIAWHGDDPWVGPISPILELYSFVTRKEVAEDGVTICEPPEWLADDTITVEEALPMMTIESAYALFRDQEVGSLKPGKFADLIILSDNPLTVHPDAIKDVQVLMTMVGGRVEYCAPGQGTLCPQPEHRIGIRGVDGVGEFYDHLTGQKFVPRGNHYIRLAWQRAPSGEMILYHSNFNPGLYDPSRSEQALRKMRSDGYNVVGVMLNPCCREGSLGDPAGGLSSAYLANVVDFLQKAKANEVLVWIRTDDVPKVGGYTALMDAYCCAVFAGYNVHYLTPGGLEANRRFWRDFIQALIAHGAPLDAIWAYSIRAEQFYEANLPPLSLTSGLVTTANGRTYDMAKPEDKQRMMNENLVYWIDQLRASILELDPTALVTIGFFWPQKPNPARIGDPRLVRTYWAIADPEIGGSSADFIHLHPYPGQGLTLAQMVENFEMTGFTRKPIVMGEFGAFKATYWSSAVAAQVLQDWQVESCPYGFDGWLLWTWDTEEQPEIWNGLDDNEVINQALAPKNRPDPCVPGVFPGQNLALGKPVTASNALPTNAPAMAVDGDFETWWGSGDFAPQWITVDLQTPVSIGQIRLAVSQYPDGQTVHQVWGRGSGEDYRLLHEFRGFTTDSQVLEYTPPAPWTGLQFIRVDTLESPSWVSWREIEILRAQ